MIVKNVSTVFCEGKKVSFYDKNNVLKTIKDIDKIVIIKPEKLLMGTEKATNITFKKPRKCRIDVKKRLVKCD